MHDFATEIRSNTPAYFYNSVQYAIKIYQYSSLLPLKETTYEFGY